MMWNKSRTTIVSAAAAGLVAVGGGVAYAAAPSSPSASHTSSTAAKAKHAREAKAREAWMRLAERSENGQVVTYSKKGPVTHDFVNGTVTAVDATSITIRTKNGATETYTVNAKTKVHARTKASKTAKATSTASTIATVKDGDHVIAVGTGTSPITADQVVDIQQ